MAAAIGLSALAAGVPALAFDSSGEIARWVPTAEKAGTAANSTKVGISVYLAFRNQAALENLVTAVSTPGSAKYGRYLSPSQFRADFAPAKADVDAVVAFLRQAGFTIGHVPQSGFYVEATGTVAQVKAAFKVDQNLYKMRGMTLRGTTVAPKLPAKLAGIVTHVAGLDDSGLLVRPSLASIDRVRNSVPVAPAKSAFIAPPTADFLPSPYCSNYWGDTRADVSPQPAPYNASIPYLPCGYTPQQMRIAYGADKTALTGTGVTVAIVDAYASPTLTVDANTYFRDEGFPVLTPSTFTLDIPEDIYNVSPTEACGPQGWFTEQSLDVESVHTIAPGAHIVYKGARNCDTPLFDADYDVIDTGEADIITNSWSEGGEFSSANEDLVNNASYLQAAAEGITVLFSSGDDGDLSQNNGVASGTWPADSPYVIAVGGTSTALHNNAGSKSEWGWGTFRAFLGYADPTNPGTVTITNGGATVKASAGLGAFSFYSGAGGGLSFSQAQPSYQVGIVPASLSEVTYSIGTVPPYYEPIPFTTPRRVIPDVAMDADPYTGFLIGETFTKSSTAVANTGCTSTSSTEEYCLFSEGGTSLASPLLAGVLALTDQQRGLKGKAMLGYANPYLYKLKVGASTTAGTPLVDVRAPTSPIAVLRAYPAAVGENPRVVTMNSIPSPGCTGGICEGANDNFNNTTNGYDDVTGLGTPNIPALLAAQ